MFKIACFDNMHVPHTSILLTWLENSHYAKNVQSVNVKKSNLVDNQLKDATKHHNKESQERLKYLLNQIKNINSKIDGMGQNKDVLPNFVMPLKTGANNNKMIKYVVRFSSLMNDTVTSNGIPPMSDELLGNFLEFTSKHHELQLIKNVGFTKTSWDSNLRMIFSR